MSSFREPGCRQNGHEKSLADRVTKRIATIFLLEALTLEIDAKSFCLSGLNGGVRKSTYSMNLRA